jgi:uncharacterized RDD family membrane protein YckC
MWYTLSVFFPLLATLMFLEMKFSDPLPTNFRWTELLTLIPITLMVITLLNKDFIGGQSVVHRKLGYKVLDVKTKETATKIQCFVRNLTGPFVWPVEVVFILVNRQRRLGDLIAGTILVDVPTTDPETILTEIKESKFDEEAKLTLIASIIFAGIFMFISRLW